MNILLFDLIFGPFQKCWLSLANPFRKKIIHNCFLASEKNMENDGKPKKSPSWLSSSSFSLFGQLPIVTLSHCTRKHVSYKVVVWASMVCFFSGNCVRLVTVLCKQARQRLSRLRQWSAGIIRKYCCHFKRRETWTTVSGRPYQQNNYTVVAPPSKTYFSWGGHLLVSNPQMFSLGPFRWAPSLQWLWT